jgi:hypothetical protein
LAFANPTIAEDRAMTTASPAACQRAHPRRQPPTLPASYTTTGDTTRVGIASAVHWMDEYLADRPDSAKPRRGERRSERIEAQAVLLMQAIEETPDLAILDNLPTRSARTRRDRAPVLFLSPYSPDSDRAGLRQA